MPIASLTIDATGAYTQWAIFAGSRPSLMQTEDGSTSYVGQTAEDDVTDSYRIIALPGGASSIVTVWHYVNAKATISDNFVRPKFYKIGVGFGAEGSPDYITTSWALYSKTNCGRPGGGSWVPADFDGVNMQIAIRNMSVPGPYGQCHVTYMRADVDYVVPSGGVIAYLVAQWLPPLLALASHAISRREVALALRSLGMRPSNDEDFARVLEAFRARPRFCFQGGTR